MTTYPLAQYSWDDADVITISSKDEQLIGTFPLEFLRRCGVNVWEYISEVVSQLVDEEAAGRLYKPDGTIICTTDTPRPGDYCYLPTGQFHIRAKFVRQDSDWLDGQMRVLFTKGPEYFRRNIPPNPNGSQSTRSDSKRSTARQVWISWKPLACNGRAHSAVSLSCRPDSQGLCLLGDGCALRRVHRLPHRPSK